MSDKKNTTELIHGNYYWVKPFNNSAEFEPAKCRNNYASNKKFTFHFTNGSYICASSAFEVYPILNKPY